MRGCCFFMHLATSISVEPVVVISSTMISVSISLSCFHESGWIENALLRFENLFFLLSFT